MVYRLAVGVIAVDSLKIYAMSYICIVIKAVNAIQQLMTKVESIPVLESTWIQFSA